ncbi:MaoC family dehydratase N-terminal domain-containing protein [Ligilactobacillus equi]|uniref:MaoC/PaaZ C-terminal domain-containing protein n=1 Tax=Ligilactobacillus equi TaxID=137357 RepID=UPI002ECFB76E
MTDDVHRYGKQIEEIKEGESLTVTETISQRDILLYLGLTNDNNPLYTQMAYAKKTEYQKPIVPPVLLTGIITSAISKHLPGPGSEIVNIDVNLISPVYHEQYVTFNFEVIKIDLMKEVVTISVEGMDDEDNRLLDAVIMVRPPKMLANVE